MKRRIRKKLAKVDAMINRDTANGPSNHLAQLLSAGDYEDTKRHLPRLNTEKMNERGVDEIIDELNEDNSNTDLTKSYLTVDELEKGERLVFALNRLALLLERARIGDYVSMMGNTWGMMIKNFLAGIARGLGYGIGFLLLGGLGLYLLHKISGWGIPVIGDFVNDILTYIDGIR